MSGRDGTGKRDRKTFRNTDEGRAAASAFAEGLKDVKTVHDVRARVGGRVVTETFRTRKDADNHIIKISHEHLTGYSIDPAGGRLTFEELSKWWIASNPGKRKSTTGRDQSALDAQMLPVLGQKQLRAIRQVDVQGARQRHGRRRPGAEDGHPHLRHPAGAVGVRRQLRPDRPRLTLAVLCPSHDRGRQGRRQRR